MNNAVTKAEVRAGGPARGGGRCQPRRRINTFALLNSMPRVGKFLGSLRPAQPIPAASQRFRRVSPRLARLTARRPPVRSCVRRLQGANPPNLEPQTVAG